MSFFNCIAVKSVILLICMTASLTVRHTYVLCSNIIKLSSYIAPPFYTVFRKKTPTYVFDYISEISWSIFVLFIPMETEMITQQYCYLTS